MIRVKRKEGSPSTNWPARIGVGLVILLGSLWISGGLDHTLYPLGMNKNECARNAFGAVFCGEELEQYRLQLEPVIDYAQ